MQEVQEGVQAVLLADSYDFALQPLTRWAAQPLSFGNSRYICQIILPAGAFRFQASDCRANSPWSCYTAPPQPLSTPSTIPLCLVPLAGRPLLDYTLDSLRLAGITEVPPVARGVLQPLPQVLFYLARQPAAVRAWLGPPVGPPPPRPSPSRWWSTRSAAAWGTPAGTWTPRAWCVASSCWRGGAGAGLGLDRWQAHAIHYTLTSQPTVEGTQPSAIDGHIFQIICTLAGKLWLQAQAQINEPGTAGRWSATVPGRAGTSTV